MLPRIVAIYDSYGLKPLITEPARETIHTSTLIDHIAVSNTNNIVESGVIKTAISDHYLPYAIRKFQGGSKRQHKVIKTRQMKHFDLNAFLQDLALIDWKTHLRSSADISTIVNTITSLISGVIQKYAPLVERRVSERYAPWISEDLKNLCKTRDRIKSAAVKNKSEMLMSAYRQLRNKATKMNRAAKMAYFSDKLQASQGDLKETWATINKLVNKRSNTTNITALEVDGQTIDDPVGMANSMNDFFSSIGVKLCNDIPNTENDLLNGDYDINPTAATFLFTPIESEQVIKAMRKFKTSQGQGLDEISSFFLKAGMPILAEPLAALFNLSLSNGVFPDLWKMARIAPIHKADATVKRSNYRPISVLPVLSRLFEKLIYDQLYNYLISNEMLF